MAKKKVFNPRELLKILKNKKHIRAINDCQKKIERLLKNGRKYLFPESLAALKKFKERGDELILISVGHKPWQRKKINGLKIKEYFDRIMIVSKEKHKNLDFLKKMNPPAAEILVINDDAGETLEMKRAIGGCRVCLIRGPYSKNVKHNLKINSLEKLLSFYD